MRALRAAAGDVVFTGVGGEAMEAGGSREPVPDQRHRGHGNPSRCSRACRRCIKRIRQTADAVIAARPDALVIIDSPDFTHRVARRVRKAAAGPADRRLCQPERLGVAAGAGEGDARLCRLRAGPAAVRAGGLCPARRPALRLCRPSADRAARRIAAERGRGAAARTAEPPIVVVLPGSRRSEIRRLMDDFGGALQVIGETIGPFEPRSADPAACRGGGAGARRALAASRRASCSAKSQKFAAFRTARAALAASGTVTLELALAGVADGRRLQGGARRGAAQISDQGSLDPAPQPHPRRPVDPREAAEGLQPGRARRGAGRSRARRAGAAGADRGARRGSTALMRLDDGEPPSAHAARAVLETIAGSSYSSSSRFWKSSHDRSKAESASSR